MNPVSSKTLEDSARKQPLRPLPKDPPPNDPSSPLSTTTPARTGPQQPKGPPPPEVLERSSLAQKQHAPAHDDDKMYPDSPRAKVPHEIAVAQMALDNYSVTELKARYTLIKKIGKGAYGAVYIAHETIPGPNGTSTIRKVAVKHIINAFVSPTDARRIYREIKVQAHFSPGHPNILPLLEVIKPRDSANFTHIYLVSELMETDLHRVIRSRQDLTSDHISYFVYQCLCALKHIHAAGVLHRDLKPSNLLVNADCTVKMCDFGLARESDSSLSQIFTEYVVTRWYRAPEVLLSGGSYTSSIDVWSVGCILGELLLRRPLFPGENYLHQLQLITEIIGSPSDDDLGFARAPSALAFMQRLPKSPGIPFDKLFPHVRGSCLDLLRRMLAFDPAKRITVDEALEHPFFFRIRNARKSISEDVPQPPPFRLRVGNSGGLRSLSVDALKARFYAELCGVALTPTPSATADVHISFVPSLADGPVKKIHEKVDEKDRLTGLSRSAAHGGPQGGEGSADIATIPSVQRTVPQSYTTAGSAHVIHSRYGMGAATSAGGGQADSQHDIRSMDVDGQDGGRYHTDDDDIIIGQTPQGDSNYGCISPDTLSYLGGQTDAQPRWEKGKKLDNVEDLQRVLESAGMYPDNDPFGADFSSEDEYDASDWSGTHAVVHQDYSQRQRTKRVDHAELDGDDSIFSYVGMQSDVSLSPSPRDTHSHYDHHFRHKRYSVENPSSIRATHPIDKSSIPPSAQPYSNLPTFSNSSALPSTATSAHNSGLGFHSNADHRIVDTSKSHSLPAVYPPPQAGPSTNGPPPSVQSHRHSGSFGSPVLPPNRHQSPLRHYPATDHAQTYPPPGAQVIQPRQGPPGGFGFPAGSHPGVSQASGTQGNPFCKYGPQGSIVPPAGSAPPSYAMANNVYQAQRVNGSVETNGTMLPSVQKPASSFQN